MNQDFLQAERPEGYPPFVCRADDAGGLNWWAPVRTGNADADYLAGVEYFDATRDLLAKFQDPDMIDFHAAMFVPPVRHPAVILGNILGGMQDFGPIEYGFIETLVSKAVTGTLPPTCDVREHRWPGEYIEGEALAYTALMLARISGHHEKIVEELIEAIGKKFESYAALAIIWTVCVAATSGALN